MKHNQHFLKYHIGRKFLEQGSYALMANTLTILRLLLQSFFFLLVVFFGSALLLAATGRERNYNRRKNMQEQANCECVEVVPLDIKIKFYTCYTNR